MVTCVREGVHILTSMLFSVLEMMKCQLFGIILLKREEIFAVDELVEDFNINLLCFLTVRGEHLWNI